jgi:hypothetical protein
MRVWVMVVGLTWGMIGAVRAEHTVDHRYTIEGYVRIADRTPRPHEVVAVADRPDARLGVTSTGTNGWYRIQLHIHNSDLGRLLHVETNHVTRQIRVTFDPQDMTSQRRHRVDFLGTQASDVPLTPRNALPYALLALGVVVVCVPPFLYFRRRKSRPAQNAGRRAQAIARPAAGRRRRADRRAQ